MHTEGFTLEGVDIEGKPNPDSWQIRLRHYKPGEAKYKTQKKKPGEENGRYDAFLPAGKVRHYKALSEKHQPFFDTLSEDEQDKALIATLGQFLIKYPTFPIVITEGAKKACCGLENGVRFVSAKMEAA